MKLGIYRIPIKPEALFFRPIGGGIIEAGGIVGQANRSAASSSALLGAASLKPVS